jgi:NAD(P)-dependent dehydrogenase (short-subunit alcohol dehydrogenase family)
MMEVKRILVTGANRGLGLALTEQLLSEGHVVFAGARKPESFVALQAKYPEALIPVELDMERPDSFETCFQKVQASGLPLDVLVNNAGVHLDGGNWQKNTTLEVSMATLRKTFEVNFFGLVDFTRRMLPLLNGSSDPRIVLVSSIMGSLTMHVSEHGLGDIKPFAYDASKTAVNAFLVHLAHALKGSPIRVFGAHPGWVATEMGTDRAPLSPQEGIATLHALAVGNALPKHGAFVHIEKELPW